MTAVAWCRQHGATVVLAGVALAVGLWLGLTAPDTSPVNQVPDAPQTLRP